MFQDGFAQLGNVGSEDRQNEGFLLDLVGIDWSTSDCNIVNNVCFHFGQNYWLSVCGRTVGKWYFHRCCSQGDVVSLLFCQKKFSSSDGAPVTNL